MTVPSGTLLCLEVYAPCTPRGYYCAAPRMSADTAIIQKATSSIERDENYVPRTRTDYGLPPAHKAQTRDYHEIFEETPIYTLLRMLAMQALGWQFYLFTNAMGSPSYPKGTNVGYCLVSLDSSHTDVAIALPSVIATFQAA